MSDLVRLRVPLRQDLPFIRALWGDAETMAPVGGPVLLDDRRAETWFRRMIDPGAPTDRYFLIEDAQGLPVGEISFHRRDVAGNTASLNVKILASRRREGLGRAALGAFLRWYFEDFAGAEITDDLRLDNDGGRRLLESFGFVRDPAAVDVHLMRLERRAWAASTSPDHA